MFNVNVYITQFRYSTNNNLFDWLIRRMCGPLQLQLLANLFIFILLDRGASSFVIDVRVEA